MFCSKMAIGFTIVPLLTVAVQPWSGPFVDTIGRKAADGPIGPADVRNAQVPSGSEVPDGHRRTGGDTPDVNPVEDAPCDPNLIRSDDRNGAREGREAGDEGIRSIALDCEPSIQLGRNYRVLRMAPDINDAGEIALADHNGVYRYDLDSDTITTIAERGETFSESPCDSDYPFVLGDPSEITRINNADPSRIAWMSRKCAAYAGCLDICDVALECPHPTLCVDYGIYGLFTADCEAELPCTVDPITCSAEKDPLRRDFEILDNGKVVYASCEGYGCSGYDPESLWRSDQVEEQIARGGDPAPGGLGTYCLDLTGYGDTRAFDAFAARPQPDSFLLHARIQPPGSSCEEFLIDYGTDPATVLFAPGEVIEGRQADLKELSKPDVGCVTCCDRHQPCAVVIAEYQEHGPPQALIEINLETGQKTPLLETDVPYKGLGGAELCKMEVSAGIGTVENPISSGPSAASGRAVFAGKYGATCKPAILLCEGRGDVTVLVEAGDSVESTRPGLTLSTFGPPVINNYGQVVFWAKTTVDCDEHPCDCDEQTCDCDRLTCGGIFMLQLPPAPVEACCRPDSCFCDMVDPWSCVEDRGYPQGPDSVCPPSRGDGLERLSPSGRDNEPAMTRAVSDAAAALPRVCFEEVLYKDDTGASYAAVQVNLEDEFLRTITTSVDPVSRRRIPLVGDDDVQWIENGSSDLTAILIWDAAGSVQVAVYLSPGPVNGSVWVPKTPEDEALVEDLRDYADMSTLMSGSLAFGAVIGLPDGGGENRAPGPRCGEGWIASSPIGGCMDCPGCRCRRCRSTCCPGVSKVAVYCPGPAECKCARCVMIIPGIPHTE